MYGFARLLADQFTFLFFALGLVVLFIGLWWLSPSVAMIVAGVIIMLLAIGAEMYDQRKRVTP